MARVNAPLLSFNRGIISPKSFARVDLDRVRLSAEVYNNWLPKTQGAMTIRPGTKYFGSSLNDTGAAWVEFVSATDDVALLELTDSTMRIWMGSDAHALALLSRPAVNTTVSLSDTGWSNTSTGGNAFASSGSESLIPLMTAETTNGVRMTASSYDSIFTEPGEEGTSSAPWMAADGNNSTIWADTGSGGSTLPSWLNVDFGSGNTTTVSSYTVRAGPLASMTGNAPAAWRLIGNNFDTGINATDTGQWTLEDSQSAQTSWAVSEKRTYTNGTPGTWRHWRLYFTTANGDTELVVSEVEMFSTAASSQAVFNNGQLTLNASSIGALARATKRVIVSDTGTEHSLDIHVSRGPVTIRVGSTDGDDDYISEASLGTGYHNLAFTPRGNFWIRLQSDAIVNRIVSSLDIGDSGTVEITTPWTHADLDNIRYDQSADVVFVDCDDVMQQKIERRGTGRSWSVVDYAPTTGPFLSARSSSAKFYVSLFYGNTTLVSDVPFFTADQVGSLVRIFHDGQSGSWKLGARDAYTDPIEMTGISDTGTPGSDSERRIIFSAGGTWAGTMVIERSIDGKNIGFKPAPSQFKNSNNDTGYATDTGTFNVTIDDQDDNLKVWYRARITAYTSGVVQVNATYGGGGVTGMGRITGYNSNTNVDFEVIKRFSRSTSTGTSTNWQMGYWSTQRGFPSAVALHGGRLYHAQGGSLFGSVADDYDNFDETTIGDAAPIIRTLGSGPVDNIHALISLLRLIIHTAGAELALRSSSIDEPITPSNSSAGTFSTNGSAALRAVKLDNRGIFVQRSEQNVLMVGADNQTALGDYGTFDLTLLVPDLLAAGVASIAIQRQPDTRLHCVLGDGTVAILTYEPQEEVVCWSTWSSDTGVGSVVEQAMVLPGTPEDAVYYHVQRTVNGTKRRYLEKWALESECVGDTGLTWIMDCASSFTDTGRKTTLTAIAPQLAGENAIVWGSLDTGSTPHVDLSPDVNGTQTTWTVGGTGNITLTGLSQGVHHAVAGLPYRALWKSTKLAYGAQMGTALAQQKRVPQTGLILYQTHARGLFVGTDTGSPDPLPRVIDGAVVDQDHIFPTLDKVAFPTPGTWDTDPRFVLEGKAPRPATVLAAIPTVVTAER